MKPKVATYTDIEILAMMVARELQTEHWIDEAPAVAAYKIRKEAIRHNNSTDLRVGIELARGIAIDVLQHWYIKDGRNLDELQETAIEIASNIAKLHNRRAEIVETTKTVRTAVSRQISNARRRGLIYRLVAAYPVTDRNSGQKDVNVNVVLERLSEYLRPELAEFEAESTGDVVEYFKGIRAEQERRTERRCQLDAVGATGRIDSVVVNAVCEAGHDIAEVLKKLATTDEQIINIGDWDQARKDLESDRSDAGETLFRLHWKNGDVYANIRLEDGVSWHEGTLSFKEAPVSITKAKGRRVRDIVDNPILGDLRITSGFGKKGGYARFGCTKDLLHFHAETGRLWTA